MPTWIAQFLAAPVYEGDEEKTRIAGLLNILLLAALAAALFAGIVTPFVFSQSIVALGVVGIIMLLALTAFWLMRQGHVRLASAIFLAGVLIAYTVLMFLSGGMTSVFAMSYVTYTVMVALLLGDRAAFSTATLCGVAGLIMVVLDGMGLLPPAILPVDAGAAWVNLVTNLFAAVAVLYFTTRSLRAIVEHSRESAIELEEHRQRLAETVVERTRNLTRRTRYLETTSAVAREAASILDVDELLPRVVFLIADAFELYRMGVFLLDPSDKWVELRAVAGEGARQLMARGYRLPVGGSGIVAHVCRTGEPYIALDVRTDPMYLDAPGVADTRSEMTVPLRARGEIIGVLSVQSNEPSTFDTEDLSVMQTLADQVAMAVSNTRLFQQAQESLEAERRAYGELSQTAWRQLLEITPEVGFLRNARGISPAGDLWRPEMEAALHTGETTVGEGRHRDVAIPIRVGGRVIGVVDARKPEGAAAWTTEDVELMEMLAEQLSIALDSARLYQDTRRRAAQDRMLGEVTTRLRETLDVKTVLETAVDEIYQSLELDRVAIHLAGEPLNEGE